MARRLPTIARWINEHCPELEARIVRGYCDTDRKIGRLRWPGKGREGNKLEVWRRGETDSSRYQPIFTHNAAETYRNNGEVEDWLRRYLEDRISNSQEVL
jgi:hypothetical protein